MPTFRRTTPGTSSERRETRWSEILERLAKQSPWALRVLAILLAATAALLLAGSLRAGSGQTGRAPATSAAVAAAYEVAPDLDAAGIRQAVLDYADSAYRVAPELIERSVHPRVQKVGYIRRRGDAEYREAWMTFSELRELAATWNREGRFDPETAKREIEILARLDRTAVARLDAEWGIDFLHLAKIEGRWQILNVLWQTDPADWTAPAADE